LKFVLETYFVRGMHYQLLAVAALIGLISVIAGAAVVWPSDDATGLGEAIWWAFLRLTDPGYLGDDTGTWRRTVSTVLTVLGYVLFMGSLVAILTGWLQRTMRRIESGVTPVVRKDHVLVLGWSARAGTVVDDVLRSEGRVRRFLRRHGARRLHIVLLAEDVSPDLVQELKERTQERWNPRRITLRSGSPLRVDHLERVAFLDAAAIVLPACDFSEVGAENVDARTIKALLSMSSHPSVEDRRDLPLVVAEVIDARKAEIARGAYGGPIEVVASDTIVGRLVAQNVRHRGLSRVYSELLTHGDGNELFAPALPQLAGRPFDELVALFPDAVLLGVVRPEDAGLRPYLNPAPGFVVEDGDRLVFMARTYDATAPTTGRTSVAPERRQLATTRKPAEGSRRVLILGWSHRVPALLDELASYADETFEIELVSTLPVDHRQSALRSYGVDLSRLRLTYTQADYTLPAELARTDPARFDNVVVMGSGWLRSGEEADARTIAGLLLLRQVLASTEKRPAVLVELLDPANAGLLGRGTEEVLVGPVILSHMLAQVALHRDLNAVFDELFTSGGAEIALEPAGTCGLCGPDLTFARIQSEAARLGHTALGVRVDSASPEGGHVLNPPKDARFVLAEDDEIIVLTTYE
jgi:hypothetical protein